MARFKKVPQNRHEGKIIYGEGIVDGIVLLSLKEIENVELCSNAPRTKLRSKAVKVIYDKNGVHIDIMVKLHYSQCVSEMAFRIQEVVRHNIESMSEYHVASVNVIVKGVTFEDLTPPENQSVAEEK